MHKNLFSNKIKYLFNKLELNQTDFTKLFWNNDPKKLSTRVKTVNNWLNRDILQPKGFYFNDYNIACFTIEEGRSAFTKESFTHDEFKSFQSQVDAYLRYEAIPKDEFEYKYIYYYDSYLNQITFVELRTIKKISEQKYKIEIALSSEYEDMRDNTYVGELEIDKNYYHISARNHFEIISFYFILNLGFKNDDAIYGLRLGKAYGDGSPLSAKNLLTKRILDAQEKRELYLNINETEELKSKEAFDDIYSSKTGNYLKTFHNKIANLSTYTSTVRGKILHDKMRNDIYRNIMSKEFDAFSKISEKVQGDNSFYIHNIRRASKVFLKSLSYRAEPCYIVSPLVENLSLFNEHDLKGEQSLSLNIELALSGLKIYRIFVVSKDFQITDFIRHSIEKMLESDISVQIAKKEEIEYLIDRSYDFIYSKSKDIAIYRKPKERSYLYHVVKDKNTIDDIAIDYKKIESKSYQFDEFLTQKYQVNSTIPERIIGRFYYYSYGSKEGKTDGELHFWDNRRVIINKEGKVQYFQGQKMIAIGMLIVGGKQSCIGMVDKNTKNNISISFDNTDTNYEIFKVIKTDKQFMEEKNMVSVGLFSREILNENIAKELLGDGEQTIFKVPSDIKNRIARHCSKRL